MPHKMLVLIVCLLGLLGVGCSGTSNAAATQGTGAGADAGADAGANSTPLPPIPTLSPADVASGQTLYAEQCASCHGPNLEGQPNWKQPLADGKYPAPPHDNSGHTWHHNDALLIAIILNGGNGAGNMDHGNMPAFKDKLSEAQARQILAFIKSHWGAQQREYQWTRTVEGT